MADPYEILSIPHSADLRTIRNAYLKMARKYHPDKSTEPDSKARMQQVKEAYDHLLEECSEEDDKDNVFVAQSCRGVEIKDDDFYWYSEKSDDFTDGTVQIKSEHSSKEVSQKEIESEDEKEEPQDDIPSESAGMAPLWRRITGKRKADSQDLLSAPMKKEVKTKVKTDVKTEIKAEVKEGDPDSAVAVKKEVPVVPSRFAKRLPLWIQMCKDFQKQKRTWAPTRPCCLPNAFLSPPEAPNRKEGKACYHKMNEEQKKQFRRWVESTTEEKKALGKTEPPTKEGYFEYPQGDVLQDESAQASSSGLSAGRRLSGVQGINFCLIHGKTPCWRLRFEENGKRAAKKFYWRHHIKSGSPGDDGREAALEAAKAEREKLVAEGILKPHDPEKYKRDVLKNQKARRTAAATKTETGGQSRAERFKRLLQRKRMPKSGVPCIFWHKSACKWMLMPTLNGKSCTIGTFVPKNDAEEEINKSLKEAIACVQAWQCKHGLPVAQA